MAKEKQARDMSPSAFTQLTQRLSARHIDHIIHTHEPVVTLDDVQSILNFDKTRLVKTLVLRVPKSLVLVALRGVDRLDYAKLAGTLGVKRRGISMATPEDVKRTLGEEIGGVAPVTTVKGVEMIFDARVAGIDRIFCGVGVNDKTLEVNTQQLIKLFRPNIAQIAQDREPLE